MTKFQVDQNVKFVGRETERDKYHKDFSQLFGQIGTIREVNTYGSLVSMEVYFPGFFWYDDETGEESSVFTIFEKEVESV